MCLKVISTNGYRKENVECFCKRDKTDSFG